jgi:hypothetical protein
MSRKAYVNCLPYVPHAWLGVWTPWKSVRSECSWLWERECLSGTEFIFLSSYLFIPCFVTFIGGSCAVKTSRDYSSSVNPRSPFYKNKHGRWSLQQDRLGRWWQMRKIPFVRLQPPCFGEWSCTDCPVHTRYGIPKLPNRGQLVSQSFWEKALKERMGVKMTNKGFRSRQVSKRMFP